VKEIRPGIAVVTRKTRIEGLLERWATRPAARFAVVQARVVERARSGDFDENAARSAAQADFEDLEAEDEVYRDVLAGLRNELAFDLPVQFVDRSFLPNLDFARFAVVVVVGQDGLVANAAKYVGSLPMVAVNPDPRRFDGVLLPFLPHEARAAVARTLDGRARTRDVTMAEARLHDGQRLLAFNDLFIGAASHVSARYRLEAAGRSEVHSSSGVIVATGAGSTGWLSSVFNMAGGVARWLGGQSLDRPTLSWEDRSLLWAVREPFASRVSQAELVMGRLEEDHQLVLESHMSSGGVIFSDGVESDFLEFSGGAIARIGVSKQRAKLVVP
jgi:hypothetical protein